MPRREGSPAAEIVGKKINTAVRGIQQEVASRGYRAANHLRTASLHVLRGIRSGRMYRVPFTRRMHQASSPGEAPANRTGMFRLSWRPRVRVEKRGKTLRVVSAIESGLRVGKWLLGELLERGTRNMAPRPYKQAVRDKAAPAIKTLYNKPFRT